jgi:hypothetical protein
MKENATPPNEWEQYAQTFDLENPWGIIGLRKMPRRGILVTILASV